MPIPLEIAYFYPLHFVMGVCKQQQMPSQFAKAFGDALIHFTFVSKMVISFIVNINNNCSFPGNWEAFLYTTS